MATSPQCNLCDLIVGDLIVGDLIGVFDDDSIFSTTREERPISHTELIPIRLENIEEMDLGRYTQDVRYAHGKKKNYCPTGFIPANRVQIFKNLENKLREFTENQNAVLHPSNMPVYATLMQFVQIDENGTYYPITRDEYNRVHIDHDRAMNVYNQTIAGYKARIATLSTFVAQEKARINKIAQLRGNTLTFPPSVINAEREIEQLQKKIERCKLPSMPELLTIYKYYSDYEMSYKKFSKDLRVYQKRVAAIDKDIELVQELMLMEIWRMPYIRYAREHDIDVNVDSDELFVKCNSNHYYYLRNYLYCKLDGWTGDRVGGTLGFILADNLDLYDGF